MQVSFPTPPPGGPFSRFLTMVLDTIRRALISAVSADEAVPHLHMQSASGGIFKITVSDSGVITVVRVGTA